MNKEVQLDQSFQRAAGAQIAVVAKMMEDYTKALGYMNGHSNPHGWDAFSPDLYADTKASLDRLIVGDRLTGGDNIGLLAAIQELNQAEFKEFLMQARSIQNEDSVQVRTLKSFILDGVQRNHTRYADEMAVFEAARNSEAAQATPEVP
jgi:hypothetical protein